MSFKVAMQALSADAAIWEESAGALSRAGAAASGLTLSDVDLSWAGQDTGLVATYGQLRDKVTRLLDEGSEETHKLSATLLEVRRTYLSADESAKAGYRGIWDYKP